MCICNSFHLCVIFLVFCHLLSSSFYLFLKRKHSGYFQFFFLFFFFQQSDVVEAPSPFHQGSTALEQAFGLYEAAFCATPLLLPDANSLRATPPPPDGSANVFEKQDSTTSADYEVSSPASKRSRHSSRVAPDPQRRPGRPPGESLPQKMPRSEAQSPQLRHTRAQKGERSSPEEHSILPQHHNAALCVC